MAATPVLWKSQTQVNTTDGGFAQNDGQVVGLADGGYLIAWTDASLAFNSHGPTVVGQRYNALGERVGGEFSLRDTPYPGGAWEYAPAVTLFPSSSPDWLGRGQVGVAYVDRWINTAAPPFQYDWGIIVNWYWPSLSFAGGGDLFFYTTTLSPAYFLADPSITPLNQGGYVVSYTLNDGAHSRIVGQIRPAGGLPGAQFDIHNQADDSGSSELATLSNGNFVAVYWDEFIGSATDIDVRFHIFTPTGSEVTTSDFVAGASGGTAETDPDVAALAAGGFVVVWTDGAGDASGQGIRATIYDNAGNMVQGDFLVNATQTGNQNEPTVCALNDGGFVVTWEDDSANLVRAQRFDRFGHNFGAEFTIRNGVADDSPDSALLANGRFAYAVGDLSTGDPDVNTSIWVNTAANEDFNGDLHSDFLWQNDNGQPGIWLMDGTTPGAQSAVGPNPGPSWKVAGSGDFDGDGKSDILWQNDNGQPGVWLMNGTTPGAQAAVGPNPGPSWKVAGSGDFNGDGKDDILWQNTNGQAGIWLMNGTVSGAQAAVGSNPGPSWKVICAGDFDGDGKSDILWQNDNGQPGVWLMNGTTSGVQAAVGSNPGPSWKVAGSGDFNGDGKDDILWQNDNGQPGIWLMNGTTSVVQAAVGPNPGPSWNVVGAADVDGDGKSDILWQNDNGQPGVWLMNGITPGIQTAVGPNPGPAWQMIHQDLDLF